MAASIRWCRCHGSGSIRLGPEHHGWGTKYTRYLGLDVLGDVGIICGLTWKLSREEYRWIEAAFVAEGLRMAMERLKPDGGFRFCMMAMPSLRRSGPHAFPSGSQSKE